MKSKRLFVILLAVLMACSICFTGCSGFGSNAPKSPQDIIKDAYGNSQYKISFSAEGLDEPLDDVYYSANSIPTLPMPTRVGYVFAGWFFDSGCTRQYADEYLYLYMCDLTLYAKWEEEALVHNGIYAIEYDAHIMDGSLVKGDLTDTVGYKDFSDAIVAEDTYIEKTDDGLRLQIRYDSGVRVAYGQTAVYTVSVSSLTDSSVTIVESILPESDTQKTIFLDISGINLSDTIYLNVAYLNYEAGLASEDVAKTLTSYVVEFNVTRFIGFESAFADPDMPLEDGTYLVKTHIYSTGGESESMSEAFNPVYSYIIAEGGEYTLIKPFAPYQASETAGIFTEKNLYERATVFSRMLTYYLVDQSLTFEDSPDYLPEYLEADSYGTLTYEFHADTQQYYYLIDLGSSAKQDVIYYGASTGPMELLFGMGASEHRLVLDTTSIVRITSFNYEPLEGDAYIYTGEVQHYSGNAEDISSQYYDSLADYSLTTALYNFFYSSGDNGETGDKVYDCKITVLPTAQTSATSLKDARYNLAHFNVVTQVYGYNVKDMDLCGDYIKYTTLKDSSESLRGVCEIRNGMTVQKNTRISMRDLYAETCNPDGDFGNVSYKAYSITNGQVNFNREISVSPVMTFEEDIAILFTEKGEDGTLTSLVELVCEETPGINIISDENWTLNENGVYTTEKTYSIGEKITVPNISYSWQGGSGEFMGLYHPANLTGEFTEDDVETYDETRIAIFAVEGGVKTPVTGWRLEIDQDEDMMYSLPSEYVQIVYELRNRYGEVQYITLEYRSETKDTYKIVGDGETVKNGNLSYNSDGSRRALNLSASYTDLATNSAELSALIQKEYGIYYDNDYFAMDVVSYVIRTNLEVKQADGNSVNLRNDINRMIQADGFSYAFVTVVYGYEEDRYSTDFVYGVRFDGSNDFSMTKAENFFTGYEYDVFGIQMTVKDEDGKYISAAVPGLTESGLTGFESVYYISGEDLIKIPSNSTNYIKMESYSQGEYRQIKFVRAGTYRFVYNFSFDASLFGGKMTDNPEVVLYQDIEVLDGNGEVEITYITDADHKFAENYPYETICNTDGDIIGYSYTVTYNLSDSESLLDSTYFVSSQDRLFGWSLEEGAGVFGNRWRGTVSLENFVKYLGTNQATLYSIWDEGLTVTAELPDGSTIAKKYYSVYYAGKGYVYSVNFADFNFSVPSGYEHLGWYGDCFEGGETDATIGTFMIEDDVVIKPILKQLLTVKYSADSTYFSGNLMNTTNVPDGTTLFENGANISRLENLSCKVEGYEFKYWAVDKNGDGVLSEDELVPFDLREDKISEDWANENREVTLIAVFGPIEA